MDPLSSRHSVEPRSMNPLPVIGSLIGDPNMSAFGRRGFFNHGPTEVYCPAVVREERPRVWSVRLRRRILDLRRWCQNWRFRAFNF